MFRGFLNNKMEIGQFNENHRAAVITLWQKCGLTVAWNDPDKDIDRKVARDPEGFLVGLDNGRVIASVMFGYDGHRGSVYYLAVDPDLQGKSLGREMMDEVEKRLLALNCPKLNLAARSSNSVVLGFYDALGYSVDPVTSLGKRLIPDI